MWRIWSQGQPLHPFGYGLSYSKFEYAHLKLSSQTLRAGDTLEVEAEVRTLGRREGDEVAHLYLSFPPSPGARFARCEASHESTWPPDGRSRSTSSWTREN